MENKHGLNKRQLKEQASVKRLRELSAIPTSLYGKDTTDCPVCKVGGVHNP